MPGSTVSQFWLPPSLDPKDFGEAFEQYFLGGKAKHIPLVPDAHPPRVPDGSHYFELTVPSEKMGEYLTFLEWYAMSHGLEIQRFPASGFGFAHAG